MADATEATPDSPQVSFKVKTSGEGNHTITMAESLTVLDLKTKLSTAEFENIPVERQRLIYSGRVMKNEEPLATYKIKTGNTVHLVKSAASNPTPAPASTSSQQAPPRPQVPTNMAAGTANNPLAGLTGARYAGLTGLPSADLFGPDGGMSGSMMDEEGFSRMLQDPNVLQQMNEMLNNDYFIDMMIQQNPMLRNQPNAREIMRSPMFRQMLTNPEALRSAQRMGRMMQGGGAGQSAFPAPGVTDPTPHDANANAAAAGNNTNNNAGSTNTAQANPFDPAAWAGLQAPGGANANNPFGNLFNPFGMGAFGAPPAAGAQTGSDAQTTTGGNANSGESGATGNAPNPQANPFAALLGNAGAAGNFGMPQMSPEAIQQVMQLMGGGGGSTPAPADNRPPEERYAEQLRQLNDMGFFDFDRNVAALRRSGGSVTGAIEHLLSP